MENTTETQFQDYKECVSFCRSVYERLLQRGLVHCRISEKNDRTFTLVCKHCHTRVVMGQKRKRFGPCFVLTNYEVPIIHFDHAANKWCHPTRVNNAKKDTISELTQSQALNTLVNEEVTCKGKKRSVSTKSKKDLLVMENPANAALSFSAIKTACARIKISPREHIESYSLLLPFFQLWKEKDIDLAYDISPKDGGYFNRLCVVMPYSKKFLPNMLCVFGVDAGHMDKVFLKGKQKKYLTCLSQKLVTYPFISL